MQMIKGQLILHDQEVSDNNYDFNVNKYMTQGFSHAFGDEAFFILMAAIELIKKTYPDSADYLQTFTYVTPDCSTDFWIINDEAHVTALLPSEY